MTYFAYKLYEINSKVLFFLADILFLGGHLRFGQILCPLADIFIWEVVLH
jgi:hypothetical protein